MILDILLPLRAENEPEERHSQELLTEVLEGELNRPRYLIGLSASAQALDSVAPFFEEHLWAIIAYNDASDDWLGQVENCARYAIATTTNTEPQEYRTDIAVVCALPDPELRAVLALPWQWSAARPIDDLLFVHEGRFQTAGNEVRVCAAAATRMGMVSSALVSSKLIELLRPRFLVMVGICAGVKAKTGIGDVIVADPSWDYQSGKRVREKDAATFAISPHHIAAPAIIRTRFDQLKADRSALSGISEAWSNPPTQPPRLLCGPLASGSAVLADGESVNEIKAQHRDLLGIEMEAYGVYSAAAFASRPQPKAVAIKSVCDFADADKDDSAQRFAAYMSAQVMRVFFERYFDELRDS
jgi:nucleoside phosphorylase